MRAGEILGFGGLVGSGRTEIARVLFGVDQPTAGTILIDGGPVAFASAGDAMARGIAYVSEDRIGQSLVMDFSILANASLPVIDKADRGRPDPARTRDRPGRGLSKRLRLRVPELPAAGQDAVRRQPAEGRAVQVAGDQAARADPRRADPGHRRADQGRGPRGHRRPRRQGLAIILISSELPELLGMCDRIVVLREGHRTAEFASAEATQERVLYATTDAGDAPTRQRRRTVAAREANARGWPLAVLTRRELGLLRRWPRSSCRSSPSTRAC